MLRLRFRHTAAVWLVVSLSLTLATRPVSAQESKQATVAFVDALSDSLAVAAILRTPGPNSQSTILLREQGASVAILASAVSALFESRRVHGEQPSKKLIISLRGAKPLEALTPNERRLGELYLARLRAAKTGDLVDVGPVRATTILLAPIREHPLR